MMVVTNVKHYTIQEVNSYLKTIFADNPLLTNIAVRGEISNLTYHSSGHIYLTLKDASSELKAVIFNFTAQRVSFKLTDGMKINAYGKITVYEPKGYYTLQISEINLDGVGALFVKYEQLKKELMLMGWFDPTFKKHIPKFPKNIGVVTASTGAAIRDIIKTLRHKYPPINIYLFEALVQGSAAGEAVAKQINQANSFAVPLDLLIVGRGGGSIEDLWAFNEMPILTAIHHSRIPIISAVGHETDTVLADFVADARAHTPTAAAELAVPNQAILLKTLFDQQEKLIKLMTNKVDLLSNQLAYLKTNYHLTNHSWMINERAQLLKNYYEKLLLTMVHFQERNQHQVNHLHELRTTMITAITTRINNEQNRIDTANQKLTILDPKQVLQRGYSITYHNNQVITSYQQIKVNDKIKTELADGWLVAQVEEKGGV